jgi:catecholate siderophore receptor
MKPLNRTASRAAHRAAHRNAARDNGSLALGLITLFTPAMAEARPRSPPSPPRHLPNPQDLGSFQVTDTAVDEGSYKTERLDSPKATAPLVDTPRTITVISRQVLDDTNSASLAEALRTVPGIALGAGEGGNPLGDRPFIRGTDSSNSMYLDGVRDMSAQSREVFAVDRSR